MKLQVCIGFLLVLVYCLEATERKEWEKAENDEPAVAAKSRKRRGWGIVAGVIAVGCAIFCNPPPPPPPPPPPRNCPKLHSPANGRLSSSQTRHGSLVVVYCSRGYSLSGSSVLVCNNGGWSHAVPSCVDLNECYLKTHDCSDANSRCINTQGAFKCDCYSGYDLHSDGKTCTKRCPSGCLHGACSRIRTFPLPTYECQCNSRWQGVACNEPICRQGCSNGQCLKPDQCVCEQGWTGASCNIPICSRGCKHGTCDLPEQCTCKDGWTGATCNAPICSNTCENGGLCSAPETCLCKGTDWTGNMCSEPVCHNGCENGGTCVAPSTCSCLNGYYGRRCEIAGCTDILPPDNGLVNCLTLNEQRACDVYCSEDYGFAYNPDNPYVCGEKGLWSHELRKEHVPECIKAEPMLIFAIVVTEFEYPGECKNLNQEDLLRIKSLTLEALLKRLDGLSSDINIRIADGESIKCGNTTETNGRLFRRDTGVRKTILLVAFLIEVRLPVNIVNVTHCNASCKATVAGLRNVVSSAAKEANSTLAEEPLSVELNGTTLYSKDTMIAIESQAACPKPGQTQIGTRCFLCGKGSYYNEQTCEPCPFHTYQDAQGQSECKACPNGTGTLWKGSKSSDECVGICSPGSYSSNATVPCTPCPMNSYQPEAGQTSCLVSSVRTVQSLKKKEHLINHTVFQTALMPVYMDIGVTGAVAFPITECAT